MNSIYDNPEYKERWAMYESALQVGLPIVSRETCAIICAMLLVWGNDERFTHHHRLVCELQYAQKRFKIEGSESPDHDFPLCSSRMSVSWNSCSSVRTEFLTILTRYSKRDTDFTIIRINDSLSAFLSRIRELNKFY